MMSSSSVQPSDSKEWWAAAFNEASQEIQKRGYDFRSFTKVKVENGLTDIFATHLLPVLPKMNIYTQVPHKKITGKKSPFTGNQKPDLMMLDRIEQKWNEPSLYAEFKFVYNKDVEGGEIKNPKQYGQLSDDRERLSVFKQYSKDTVCLQAIFFCWNPESAYKKQGPRDSLVDEFLKQYCDREQHSKTHERKSARMQKKLREQKSKVVSKEIISLVDEVGFWLSLVLLEIEPANVSPKIP